MRDARAVPSADARTGKHDAWTAPADGADDPSCAYAAVTLEREPPTVWLLVDRVLANFAIGNDTVYSMLWRDVMGAEGIVTRLEDSVRFGFIITGLNDSLTQACPNMAVVEPALHNRSAIAAMYPEFMGAQSLGVPFYSLREVLTRAQAETNRARLRSQATIMFVPQAGERLCVEEAIEYGALFEGAVNVPIEQDDRLVKELAALGVRTYVLGSNLNCHGPCSDATRLARMAELGGTGHGHFLVGMHEQLTQALREITSSLSDCQISLAGTVEEDRACSGEVRVDGTPVPCDDANGWHLTGPSSLELVGAACDTLREKPSAKIEARFPCDVVFVF